MLCSNGCNCHSLKEFNKLQKYVRALHCPIRWTIIRLIGNEAKSTREIFDSLTETGDKLSKSGLYYHLSELEEAGIIKLAEYREVGGGAPEKVWKLNMDKLVINFKM